MPKGPTDGSAYMIYWSKERLHAAEANGKVGKIVPALYGGPHVSHPSLRRYHVSAGDSVFPVAAGDGRLFVICHVVVDGVYDILEYAAIEKLEAKAGRNGGTTADWMFLAPTCTDDIATVRSATPIRNDRFVPAEQLGSVRILTKKGERPVSGLADGRVKHTAGLTGHYFRLSASTVELFRSLTG